jgi:hypothetical protein
MRILSVVLVGGLGLTLGCGRGSLILEQSGGSSTGPSSGAGTGTSSSSGVTGTGSGGTPGTDVADATVDGAGQPMGGTIFDAGSSLPPGPCGPFTCPDGCCQSDGTCFVATAGAVNTPCGSNGEACTTCAAGEMCFGGCVRDLGETCSATNCAGCCLLASTMGNTISTSTQCADGTQDSFCGSGGAQCNRCSPATNGGHCVADSPSGGHCEDVGQCNATNCAGCCLGNVCAEGQQNVACGIRGAACQDCSDGGQCLGLGTNDGGVDYWCGYDCPGNDVPACSTVCTSPSNCVPLNQVFNSGQ